MRGLILGLVVAVSLCFVAACGSTTTTTSTTTVAAPTTTKTSSPTTTRTSTTTSAAPTTTTASTTTAAAPTKAQYIASADAVCRSLAQKNKAVTASVSAAKINVAVGQQERKKNKEAADAQLRALPEPTADRSTIAEWLHQRELTTSPPTSASDFIAYIKAVSRADKLARSYGLQACA